MTSQSTSNAGAMAATPIDVGRAWSNNMRERETAKEATASGRSLREVAREAGVDEAVLDEALDFHAMAKPHD